MWFIFRAKTPFFPGGTCLWCRQRYERCKRMAFSGELRLSSRCDGWISSLWEGWDIESPLEPVDVKQQPVRYESTIKSILTVERSNICTVENTKTLITKCEKYSLTAIFNVIFLRNNSVNRHATSDHLKLIPMGKVGWIYEGITTNWRPNFMVKNKAIFVRKSWVPDTVMGTTQLVFIASGVAFLNFNCRKLRFGAKLAHARRIDANIRRNVGSDYLYKIPLARGVIK